MKTQKWCLRSESNYLRWDKNFPVECPEPSQPGIGHLQQTTAKRLFSLIFKLWNFNEISFTWAAQRLVRRVVLSLVCSLSGNRISYDVTNNCRWRVQNHRIRMSGTWALVHGLDRFDTNYFWRFQRNEKNKRRLNGFTIADRKLCARPEYAKTRRTSQANRAKSHWVVLSSWVCRRPPTRKTEIEILFGMVFERSAHIKIAFCFC